MKRFRTVLIIVVAAVLLLGIKFIFFPSGKETKKQVAGRGTASAATVTVFVAENEKEGNRLFTSGTIVANEEADLHPESSGRIEYMHLPEGEAVKKGTLLLKINDREIQAQLTKIKSQIRLAEGNLARQQKLLAIEGASMQEFEQASADLNSLKADSTFYMAQILKTEIRAPFDGVTGIRQVSMGSYVTPATVITTILQINPVKIDFYLPEKYAGLLSTGDNIQFTTEGSNKINTAQIKVKDPKIDITNRSIRYRAICANSGGLLMPGAFVRINLSLKGNANTIFIPTEAAIATLKGKKVFVVKNGLAEERDIETGLRTPEKIQVLSGLNKGDSVVVTGNYQLKKGTSVRIQSPEKQQPTK